MENTMIPQGIEIVQKAIEADNNQEYEKSLALYRDALQRFTLGLKYEKNEARKKLILDRVEGYMKRAEELSDYLKKQSELDKGGGGGVAAKSKDGKDGEDEMDEDKKKLRDTLAEAIVTEKPNVSWDDVAGLHNAKESLKEVCPQVLVVYFLLSCSSILSLTKIPTLLLTRPKLKLQSHRRSFYQRNSRNSSRASENPSKVFCSTAHPEQESLI